MNARDRKICEKIITHIEHIQRYTADISSAGQFSADVKTVEASVFNMMQIGELAHSELSDECKNALSSIPWNEIYGMRNRIVHGYGEVSLDIVWEVIESDLQILKTEIVRFLSENPV